jgi:hypothetical protein
MTRPIENLKMLFNRRPRLLYTPKQSSKLIDPAVRADHPALAHQFAEIESLVDPAYEELDQAALRSQNWYRLLATSLIVVGGIATVVGGLQGVFKAEAGVFGGIETALGIVLAVLAYVLRQSSMQKRYVRERLAAERVRGEPFLYLTGSGPYVDAADPDELLRARVETAKGQAFS